MDFVPDDRFNGCSTRSKLASRASKVSISLLMIAEKQVSPMKACHE